MKRYLCCNCETIYTGWGVGEFCPKCGGRLELIEGIEKIERIENDVADIKLQNKVNEYKERYPEHFKEVKR